MEKMYFRNFIIFCGGETWTDSMYSGNYVRSNKFKKLNYNN